MPIYTYQCQSCDNVTEKRQSFSDDPLTTCEACSGDLRRLIHPAGIVFKGSGFYNTDYRGNGAAKPGAESAKPDGEGTGATTSDGAATSEAPAKSDTGAKSEGASKADGGSPAPAKTESTVAAKAD